MKILHYNLGIPPYRSGGLTKYSIDLMQEQVKSENEVILLYPGKIRLSNNKVQIKQNIDYRNITIFEIINPLPVPLLGGVIHPKSFMKSLLNKDKDVYIEFLDELKPDVIHIHTLMGLHKEFLKIAKDLGVKLVFTSHDYYGICPKVNLVDYKGEICGDYQQGEKCISCNKNAYSINQIKLMQSHTYKSIKGSKLMNKFRKIKKRKLITSELKLKAQKNSVHQDNSIKKEYISLRKYYISMLNMIDTFHFNSEVTKNEYEKYIKGSGKVISITHSDIKDNRIERDYSSNNTIQLGFIGPIEMYKGFPLLRESLLRLLGENEKNWHLHVYGNDKINELILDSKFITFHGKYNYMEIASIFNNIDILIIPSICKETFGFIGLEALSYGVPIIVNENVGFKDLLKNQEIGLIIDPNKNELAKAIKFVINNRSSLKKWNKNIYNMDFNLTIDIHSKSISKLYQNIGRN